MNSGFKTHGKRISAGAAAIATLGSIGYAGQEYMTVKTLTEANIKLLDSNQELKAEAQAYRQQIESQIQAFVLGCNTQLNDRNAEIVACYEKCTGR